MSLLSWPTALIAAALSVPLLLLLYFLKLRRQERQVSSTLLWKRAVHDLQVNAPFQKLRKNLLLFLQLLILAAVLFGLANPVANFMKKPERNIVLLLDRSGSMKTEEADGRTRLEYAKDAAEDFVSGLSGGSRVMVIGFADRASVVCSFTDDKRRLRRQIRGIEPTDGPSRIGEALQLAVAYSSNLVDIPGVATPEAAMQGSADIELFSDGRIADADEEYVTRGNLRFHRIGAAVDNVGIVAFDVRRDYERPGMLSVFTHIENFGPSPVTLDVSLLLDGQRLSGPGSVQEVKLGAARPAETEPDAIAAPDEPGVLPASRSVVFDLHHESGGLIEIRLHREDALAIDNAAIAPIDPPREVRVLVVSGHARVRDLLVRGLRSIGVDEPAQLDPQAYETATEEDLVVEGRSAYDLVILEDHDTDRLPPGSYLFFGGVPKIESVSVGEEISGQPLVLWQENHPLTRRVMFENVFVAKWSRLTLPERAVRLVEGEDSVVMAFITDPGHQYVVSAFDLIESDFLWEPAFVIFLQNMVMFCSGSGLTGASRLVSPGETLTLHVPPGAEEVRVVRPDSRWEEINVEGRHTVTYARTHDAGVYVARFDDPGETAEVFAANTLDATESRISPNERFTIGAEEVVSVEGEVKVNEPLWPYAAGLALMVLLVEWWVYNRRVMV